MKRKKGGIAVKILIIAFACYVVFTLVSIKVEINRKTVELQQKQAELTELEIINEEKERRNSEENEENAKRQAAEENNYAYPNDEIIIDQAGNN